jgi:hypothetical protein
MATFLTILEKIQAQTLENVKQLEAVQIATLTTAREVIAELRTAKSVPTFSEITNLSASFANDLLDQQKTFVNELVDVVKSAAEDSKELVSSAADKSKELVSSAAEESKDLVSAAK